VSPILEWCISHVLMRCMVPKLSSVFWTAWEWRSLHFIWCLSYESFIHDFGSVTLLFFDTPISGVWSENSGVMLPKSWTEDTQGRHQLTCDGRYSYMGLGHILPNRVLTCHLSSLTSRIGFRSIEYDRESLPLEPSHLLTMIEIMCMYIT
jgi:hypothetical protein